MRLLRYLPLLLLLVVGLAVAGPAQRALPRAQDNWSAAIRWGDFDGAINLIDPAIRAEKAPNSIEMARYKQVQISTYHDVGASADYKAGLAVRDIEIGVINRNTLAERTVRYRETWRWDPQAKAWWITSGLPDLWAND
ncbi:hypothetical protein DWG18_14295 [Lysobacter sp. TY2-98]|uniref:hypothetical protein n=1 Tax=Lysobacter sp. TY2-98 TaxID=2290922 RepID=UPI000E1FB8B6|nr:hypothetical protein [Lysobacter sp. TY2-98]AXK73331.1 hypothetical protein DWG18_14295 [Lysobacter sp. TY2-98]